MMDEKIAQQLARLSPEEQRKLLAQLLQKKAQAPKPKMAPLSFGQERLWFWDQLEPGSAAYNLRTAVKLNGRLHLPALQKSLNEVVQRHESLRTIFVMDKGRPVQAIQPSLELELPIVDLQQVPVQEREATFEQLAATEAQKPFDLAKGPLLRVTLLQTAPEEHILLITKHHTISDGWSIGIFIRELGLLYTAFAANKPSPLPPLSIQYADFAVWQREWLAGEVLNKQITYWLTKLQGSMPALVLPTDFPRPAMQTYRGAREYFAFPKALSAPLHVLSQREGATLFMTLLAAFKVLLYRHSHQEDILIGTPIAGRTRDKVEPLIGLFINTLVLRTDLSGNPSFTEFLARVKETALGAYAHQDLPFGKLVEAFQPVRDASRSPLFQVMFVLQNAPLDEIKLPGLNLTLLRPDKGTSQFDLTLTVWDGDDGINGYMEYNTDLFESRTIQRMVNHYRVLLTSIAQDATQRIVQLPLLTEAEEQFLLPSRPATAVAPTLPLCLHQRFEEQVRQNPTAIAVSYQKQHLTYTELNRRANQLAHHLRSLGVGPETLVGLYVERSLHMIVGLLAILKAGGAYVPLDPTYPADRVTFMLEDSQAAVLLTQESLLEGLPRPENAALATVFCLDRDWPLLADQPTTDLAVLGSADNLAYIIYTSGSTGRPKGVLIPHVNVMRLFTATDHWYHFNNQDVWTLFHSYAFDFSVWEIWGALLYGGRLLVVPHAVTRDTEAFHQLLSEEQVTVLNQTPSAFRQLVTMDLAHERPLSLRYVIFGGEALDIPSLQPWFQKHGDQKPFLVNMYGITETTVHVTYQLLTESLVRQQASLIGEPIPDLQLFILDSHLQPVPVGVPGELHVGGAGLARGYLNRPELTAERFIEHALAGGGRLYRTGDLARWLPTAENPNQPGNIEYMGRIDHQVKIRGFRIELGEITATLQQQKKVTDAVVVAQKGEQGVRLVAYVIGTASARDLREALAATLPDYMVPSRFVFLEKFPLTVNGKLDTRALPDTMRPDLAESYVAPRTPIEEMLAGYWAELLELPEVGIYDSFFDLGGHSLLATQLVSRIRQEFQVELPLRQLFERPTVAALAERIESARRQREGMVMPRIEAQPRQESIPLSFAQMRLWLLDQISPGQAAYNMPAALHLQGHLDITALQMALDELICRHDSLRTTFPLTAVGQPEQRIAPPHPFDLVQENMTYLPPQSRAQRALELAQAEALRPFDLAQGPLLRVILIKLGEEEYVLTAVMHHIIGDGWSVGLFVRELTALYTAYSQNQPSPLNPLPIQYPDFAIWQKNWLQGEILQKQVNYWKKQLADLPSGLKLPTDNPRPAVQTFVGASQSFTIPASVSQSLLGLSRQEGATLFMTLLAAFQLFLYRYSQQEDIAVGAPIANRNHAEIEGLIGFFVNTLVFRAHLGAKLTFRQLLAQVRETVLDAQTHQDLPFEKLVDELHSERNLSQSPLFQVMFVLQKSPAATSIPNLTVKPIKLHGGTAKFDLTLVMVEEETGLNGTLEYNTDLYHASTIERMLGHFQILLDEIVSAPNRRLAEFPLLTQNERHQTMVLWNATHAAYRRNITLPEQFEIHAYRHPHTPAVVYQDQRLTYGELDRRANQLANYLIQCGVKQETLVGVFIDRSIDMIVAILGILKAGGAYVPLDPTYPLERIAFMLEDTQATVLLTQTHLLPNLPAVKAQVVCLDDKETAVAHASTFSPAVPMSADNLAYVIYTSGSTGRPKGVCCAHAGVFNLLAHFDRWRTIREGSPCAVWTSFNFDVSVYEIFSALTAGGTLHIVPEAIRLDTHLFAQWLVDNRIYSAYIPPFMLTDWMMLLRQGATPPPMRRLLVGVEPIAEQVLAELSRLIPNLWAINGYGPTEATVCATLYSVPKDSSWQGYTPIGYPTQNLKIYLLDPLMQPVPVGVAGELYVGGIGLARGYFQRPSLTADRFIPDPFSNEPGGRLYRTGDLVRYLPNGVMMFVGRADQQVKIRGFRIELGEIETLLRQEEAIRDTLVLIREDTPGDKRIVAYFVPKSGAEVDVSALRQALQRHLPEYMMPSAFVPLVQFPVTPNGKIDHKALPAPDVAGADSETDFVAPRNPIEEILAGYWADLLQRPLIGIHHNFFELGGHSLLATQLVSRIRRNLQVEIPVRQLFEQPTVAALAEKIEMVRREQDNVLKPRIEPQIHEGDIPLSFAQQRLWLLDVLEPGQATYNIPTAVRLLGQLHPEALQKALDEIVRRHASLRTVFTTNAQGEPIQTIYEALTAPLKRIDLRALPAAERESKAQELAREEAQTPFHLGQWPLLRVTLLQLDNEEYVLTAVMHHIISDGWSVGIFIRELMALYTAYSQNKPSPLPALPIQYPDFAVWQKAWLSGEALENQLAYWRNQLAGTLPVLSLPTDRPRGAVQTYNGANFHFELPPSLSKAVKALGQSEGTTLFMTLLAAFNTWLYRLSGQTDIIVGSPIANRNHAEIEGLIGFFVNTLALRTQLDDDPTFSALLARVRETLLGAYAHQDLPFEKLVEEIRPERSLNRSPIFQVMFAFQNTAVLSGSTLGNLTLQPVAMESGTAKYDLTLYMQETAVGLSGMLEYNTDLFDEATIARFYTCFEILLTSITDNPAQKVSRLNLLSNEERYTVLQAFNQTAIPYPQELCLHELFEAQAARVPEATAVVFADQALTYAQLNQRANQLAHHLRLLGVGPEVLVGLCVERSLDMVVGLLAILKAGGAYVPLDPSYPADRLAFMLEDSQLPVLLTQANLIPNLPAHKAQMVAIDADWETIAQQPPTNVRPQVQPYHLAYIIYTSGSTGKPKGVQIPHRAVVNFLTTMRQAPGMTEKDTLLAVTTLSFDIAGLELYLPLTTGAKVVIVPRETVVDGSQLMAALNQTKPTVMQATPSSWRMLLELGWSGDPNLKILCGGEAFPPQLVAQLLERCGSLWNMYGPTETTIWSAIYPLRAEEGRVPIGKPIGNTQLYVLDAQLQPVIAGVPGELHIGGDGLARGYRHRPGLTAEKFIPHPFATEPGSFLYKTGDLVRLLPSGDMEYLSRMDGQVKIRGYRIELGEIESVLRRYPGVRETAVIVREDVPEQKTLVAYVVADTAEEATAVQYRAFLRQHLPDYMIPANIVTLPSMPLTPNGKTDRRALPAPSGERATEKEYQPPQTEIEQILATILQEVLQINRVGLQDNFFDLGAHSLLLMKAHARMQTELKRELAAIELFKHPTISDLAKFLTQSTTPTSKEAAAELGLESAQERERKRRAALKQRQQQSKLPLRK